MFFKKLKIVLPYNTDISFIGRYTKKIELLFRDIYSLIFIALFTMAEIWKQTKSLDRLMEKPNVIYMWGVHMGVFYIHVKLNINHLCKGENATAHAVMVGAGRQCAQWKVWHRKKNCMISLVCCLCLCCSNKMLEPGQFVHNNIYFLKIWRLESPRSSCWQICCLVRKTVPSRCLFQKKRKPHPYVGRERGGMLGSAAKLFPKGVCPFSGGESQARPYSPPPHTSASVFGGLHALKPKHT